MKEEGKEKNSDLKERREGLKEERKELKTTFPNDLEIRGRSQIPANAAEAII